MSQSRQPVRPINQLFIGLFTIVHPKAAAALVLVSAAAVALNCLRVGATGQWKWLFLSWNLFLAWVPLVLAWAVCHWRQNGQRWSWKVWAGALSWIVFFPNAPYIFTDLVHLTGTTPHLYWLDMMLISLFALTGLVVGFVSLQLMHEQVARRFGWITGWTFTAAMAGLSAIGVFIGRFLRWNSWDALLNPADVVRSLLLPSDLPASRLKFTLLFAVFVFLAYLMLYALTHLRPVTAKVPACRA